MWELTGYEECNCGTLLQPSWVVEFQVLGRTYFKLCGNLQNTRNECNCGTPKRPELVHHYNLHELFNSKYFCGSLQIMENATVVHHYTMQSCWIPSIGKDIFLIVWALIEYQQLWYTTIIWVGCIGKDVVILVVWPCENWCMVWRNGLEQCIYSYM